MAVDSTFHPSPGGMPGGGAVAGAGVGAEAEADVADAGDEGLEGLFAVGVEGGGRDDEEPLVVPDGAADEPGGLEDRNGAEGGVAADGGGGGGGSVEAAAKRHPSIKAVHSVFFDDARAAVSFDVLVDFTVRDRDAFRAAILADLEGRFPGRTLSLAFDTDYSD